MNAPVSSKGSRKLNIEALIRASANFHEFFTTLSSSSDTKFKGDAFERLTQLYLLTCPTYRAFGVKIVWLLSEVPPHVAALLNLPRKDLGIDLVVETTTGENWAVQCKFRSRTAQALTMGELATFTALSFVHCKGFAQTIVAHTVERPIENRRYMGNVSEVGLERWYEIDGETWENIQKLASGDDVLLTPYSPRPHQEPAIAEAVKHYAVHRRGRMIMPYATGKSLTSYFIAEALDATTILVAVPSLALMKQSIAVFAREDVARGIRSDYLCVCSDESVADNDDESEIDVADLGVPVLSKVHDIAAELKTPGRKVVFTTYHSSPKLAAAAQQSNTTFDLGILDEAHRTVVPLSKDFATLLRENAINITNRLFMTATERVLSGESDAVASMDNERIYGRRFFLMTFKDAIDQKIISDYKIVTYTVSQEHIRQIIENNRLIDLSSDTLTNYDAEQVAAGIALLDLYDRHGITHAISFSRSIRKAKELCEQQNVLNAAFGNSIVSDHMNGTYSAGQRSEIMRQFKQAPRALLTNARCLTEGVDVPAIDAVLFADPRKGVVDIVQAVGRALRLYDGKQYGYVLLPIIVPEGMTFEEFAESTAFKQVARIVAVLSTQDERIVEECRAIEEGRQRNGYDRIIDIIGNASIGMKLDLREFREAVQARIWEKVARLNWRKFEDARQFARGLGLKNYTEWNTFAKSRDMPSDIPSKPHRTYADQGWVHWGDFLGTRNRKNSFIRFEDARNFVRALKLNSKDEYEVWQKSEARPAEIPAMPHQAYRDKGWAGWSDFLGNGRLPKNRPYRSYEEAQQYARDNGLKSSAEWWNHCKSDAVPDDIPYHPARAYPDKWTNWFDFLGTRNNQAGFRTYEEAKKFVYGLGLRSQKEYFAWAKTAALPDDIPAAPHTVYEDNGWIDWPNWLGNGRRPFRGSYWTYEEAQEYALGLGLKSVGEWKKLSKAKKLPTDIPSNPNRTYEDQWKGWADFLGFELHFYHRRGFRPYVEAQEYAAGLGLKSSSEWHRHWKSNDVPNDIPTRPDTAYSDEWTSWGDFLGTGNVAHSKKVYCDFASARTFVHSLGLKNNNEWLAYAASAARPADIPRSPRVSYRNKGWVSLGDWLGTGYIALFQREYMSFEEARAWVQPFKLKSKKEWDAMRGERPENIPAAPDNHYRNRGWTNWGDFLGNGNTPRPKIRKGKRT